MSHNWITPVTDRSSQDITDAQTQITAWKNTIVAGGSVSMTDLKGTLNFGDINRVGNDLLHISENDYYLVNYFSFTHVPSTSWSMSSVFNTSDLSNLLAAAQELKDAYILDYSMSLPDDVNTYEKMNQLESYVLLLKQFEEGAATRQEYADTFWAGTNALLTDTGFVASKTIIAVISEYNPSTGYETIFFRDECTTHTYDESTGVLDLAISTAESISYEPTTGILSVVMP